MTPGVAVATAERKLAEIVGPEYLVTDPKVLEPLAIDGIAPRIAVTPTTPEEVAAVLQLAWEHELVVVPTGGLTRLAMGGIPSRIDVLLGTHRLNGVEKYDPGDLTISLGAGIRLAELDQVLATHQQFLPIDAAQPEQATIGGTLASAAHGPMKHFYGSVREFCIGIKFATADGKLAKAGGHVVKNVAGYDLMKLLIGSFGTLGVIVSANFKVFPRPRQTRTFVADFASLREAFAFRDRMLHSPLTPMCLEICSPGADAFLEVGGAKSWRVFLRAAGSDAVLTRYRVELGTAVSREIESEAETGIWRAFSDFPHSVATKQQRAVLVQISVPIQAVGDVLAAAERAASEQSFACAAVGRIGVGSLIVALVPFGGEPPVITQYANAISSLRSALPRDGSAVVMRCPHEAKQHFDVWGSTPTDLGAMRVIKRALDEKNILSRGRFLV